MDPETLFGMALGLMPPWQIRRIEFSTETARLDISLDGSARGHLSLSGVWCCRSEGLRYRRGGLAASELLPVRVRPSCPSASRPVPWRLWDQNRGGPLGSP